MTVKKTGKNGNPHIPPGPGRPKGMPNKSTALAREAIARFVDENSEKLQLWLDEIAEKEGPKAAFNCFMDVVEYHVPKLARTELTGKDGDTLEIKDWSDMDKGEKFLIAKKIAFLLTSATHDSD